MVVVVVMYHSISSLIFLSLSLFPKKGGRRTGIYLNVLVIQQHFLHCGRDGGVVEGMES